MENRVSTASNDNPDAAPDAGMAVSVVADRDEWNVVIVENGVERLQSFVQYDWALSYARGQRLRLGLPALAHASIPAQA
ncbi:hypothetical protein [Rhizobium sp. NFR03]|uniref:hypothetical protein n=1 Tax=Rhizobium sp. NFR03 TaxID=1566263 RepID=UPI0008CA360C|nr:hypothetical protein [Rhizobium sp. NFR03]SER49119.1 hypothetical protein SAMN03159406_00226 [Rhizobium sp. NFR03]